MDRRFNPVLRPLINRVYVGKYTDVLSRSLKTSLMAVRDLLPDLPVRSLERATAQEIFITDASFKSGRGVIAGVRIVGKNSETGRPIFQAGFVTFGLKIFGRR